jgi:hypothetical protein
MEWEFSPEDVVKGRAEYGLAEFRHDLAMEVRGNTGGLDEAGQTRTFNLLYDLCYALATDRDLDRHLEAYAYDPPTCQFLREMTEPMAPNVEMLGAILQRQIMNLVDAGMPLDNALSEVGEWHTGQADGRMP